MRQKPEDSFHKELLALYDRCAALGFRPGVLRRAVVLNGGVRAARDLVFMPGATGLERLAQMGKPELSMEAMMLRPDYRPLFTQRELEEAAARLESGSRARSRGRLAVQAVRTER